MSVKEKQEEAAKHISDVDEQIREVDRHIEQARKTEEEYCHPAPGIDVTAPKRGPGSAEQFSA
jgi:hypothetical protein